MQEILLEIFIKNGYAIPFNRKGITLDNFIAAIALNKSITKTFSYGPTSLSRFLTKVFPDRPKTKNCLQSWLLSKDDKKYCPYCSNVLSTTDFDINSNKSNGLNSYCKPCNMEAHGKAYYTEQRAKRRAAILQRTPIWSNLKIIKEIYVNCPNGMHVDHIIPLQGEKVSGLHVPNNLQYLTPSENAIKGNKFIVL